MGNCCSSLWEAATHSKQHKRLQGWKATGVVGLRNENLKELPLVLRELSGRLTALDASMNQLRSLPSFMGEFDGLQRLVLARNKLIALPDELSRLNRLKVNIPQSATAMNEYYIDFDFGF